MLTLDTKLVKFLSKYFNVNIYLKIISLIKHTEEPVIVFIRM